MPGSGLRSVSLFALRLQDPTRPNALVGALFIAGGRVGSGPAPDGCGV
jgi:hypothetical protein